MEEFVPAVRARRESGRTLALPQMQCETWARCLLHLGLSFPSVLQWAEKPLPGQYCGIAVAGMFPGGSLQETGPLGHFCCPAGTQEASRLPGPGCLRLGLLQDYLRLFVCLPEFRSKVMEQRPLKLKAGALGLVTGSRS